MSEFSINEIIELAIQIEESGYNFYDNVLKNEKLSAKAKKIFEHLRNEEAKHKAYFKKLRSKENLEEIIVDSSWNSVSSYLKTISDFHIFNKKDAAINLTKKVSSTRAIIKNAIGFEKDTLLFFYSLDKEIKHPETKDMIEEIIAEEVAHVMQLKDFLKEINKK